MSIRPPYHQAHLIVAAIRIIEAREKHPPCSDEIAKLLQWHPDQASLFCRGMEEAGVLAVVQSPYAIRYEIIDHLKLEEFEAEDADPGFEKDLVEYEEKTRQEQERLEKLFSSGEAQTEHQKKMKGLDDEFSSYQGKKPANPFGDS